MSHKLKGYVCSRILEVLRLKCNQSTSTPTVLSNHISVGKAQDGTNIEFLLPVTSLQKVLGTSLRDKQINVSEIKHIVTDDVICEIHEESIKNNINIVFEINRNVFIKEVLQDIVSDPVMWRKTLVQNLLPHAEEKKVIIEYSSPNIAKPFHMGHLRSTIIGNFIANILEFMSHKVVRINYLGDWGTQFGLLQVGLELCGYSETMIKQNPMQLLYQAYVEANKRAEIDPSVNDRAQEAFHCLEAGNTEKMKKWQLFRRYTEEELQNVYRRLGVCFDEYNWESDYSAKRVGSILHSLKTCGIIKTENDGKQVVEINPQWHVPVMKSDGSTLYLMRDISAAVDRYDRHNFAEMLYVVGSSQAEHFKALFGVLSSMQLPWASTLKHVKFGRIQGMSTRKGSVIFLTDILDEIHDIMATKQQESRTTKVVLGEHNEKTTDILGTSAVIINDLKQRRQKDYEFDWNRALQVQGDTGVKLQYTHCRLWNLEKNSGISVPLECDARVLQEPEAVQLVKNIARFDEVIMKSYEELEACILVNYLLRFCNVINRAFEVLRVKDEDAHIGSQRLLLFHSSRVVLNQGMKILGLQPLHHM